MMGPWRLEITKGRNDVTLSQWRTMSKGRIWLERAWGRALRRRESRIKGAWVANHSGGRRQELTLAQHVLENRVGWEHPSTLHLEVGELNDALAQWLCDANRKREVHSSPLWSKVKKMQLKGLLVIRWLWVARLSASCPPHFLASVLIHPREALSVQHVLISWGHRASPTPSHMCWREHQLIGWAPLAPSPVLRGTSEGRKGQRSQGSPLSWSCSGLSPGVFLFVSWLTEFLPPGV